MIRRQPLYPDQATKDRLEGRNARLLYRRVLELIPACRGEPKDRGHELRLTAEIVSELHNFVIRDIYACAGQFRSWSVKINGSRHIPPEGDYIESLMNDMCDTANENSDWVPIATAAFLLRKVNWIHPFGGGNGRTSRAVAYLALCVRLGFIPPGQHTIAHYIDANRKDYINALRDADDAWGNSQVVDISVMRALLDDWLKKQLSSVLNSEG